MPVLRILEEERALARVFEQETRARRAVRPRVGRVRPDTRAIDPPIALVRPRVRVLGPRVYLLCPDTRAAGPCVYLV